ncbi:hypothetical protein GALL_477680 [mine drainage metagenome]|uniref:Uncharacterized protein n=1 Tax=mine drainage metagenome TaxID=410659 RepID=A0A1J5PZB3_9ZZZZ
MRAAFHRLEQRHPRRQQDRQRDRNIHPQPPRPQRAYCVAKERLRREDHHRHSDQRRNPVEHRPRRALCPGPDRDRQQHDVHHGEPRHRQPHQQIAAMPVVRRRGQLPRVQLICFVAQPLQRGDHAVRRDLRRAVNRHPHQRQVHPHLMHTRHQCQPPLDCGHADGAMHRRHRQHHLRGLRHRACRQRLRRGNDSAGWAGRGGCAQGR